MRGANAVREWWPWRTDANAICEGSARITSAHRAGLVGGQQEDQCQSNPGDDQVFDDDLAAKGAGQVLLGQADNQVKQHKQQEAAGETGQLPVVEGPRCLAQNQAAQQTILDMT